MKAMFKGRRFLAPIVCAALTAIGLWGWAASLPLTSASVAPGRVQATGERRTVQPSMDGRVSAIFVAEGEHVEAGQVLIAFDPVEVAAEHDRLLARYFIALASQARSVAQIKLSDRFPAVEPLIGADDERWFQAKRAEAALLQAIVGGYRQSAGDTDRQLEEGRKQLEALDDERLSVSRQLSIAENNVTRQRKLMEKNVATVTAFAQAEDRTAALNARLARLASEQAEVSRALAALSASKAQLEADVRQSAARDLRAVQSELFGLEQDLKLSSARLDRLELVAPIAGRVFELAVNTLGAVVRSGEVLAEIVPADGRPVVLAKLDPRDADDVLVGDTARIRLTGANPRRSTPLEGVVERIAADASTDAAGGSYHEIEVAFLDAGEATAVPLMTGAPAEVVVLRTPRTVWQALSAPLRAATDRAMREP